MTGVNSEYESSFIKLILFKTKRIKFLRFFNQFENWLKIFICNTITHFKQKYIFSLSPFFRAVLKGLGPSAEKPFNLSAEISYSHITMGHLTRDSGNIYKGNICNLGVVYIDRVPFCKHYAWILSIPIEYWGVTSCIPPYQATAILNGDLNT